MGAIPLLNVLAPGLAAQQAAEAEEGIRNQQLQNAGRIELPEYGSDRGVQMQYAGDYAPDAYADPTLAEAQQADDSPEGRAAQLAALQSLGELTDQSVGSSSAQRRNVAELDARQLASSREGAIRQDAMRRGQLGGAADMISRQQAAQAAANQNLNAGLQGAEQAALQALAGTQAQGALAGQLRGQDLQRNMFNTNAANQFDLFNTNNLNNVARANTDMSNAAQLRNLNARQDFNNDKTDLGWQKLKRNDQNANSGFAAQMGQYGAVNNALEGQAGAVRAANSSGQAAGQQGYSNFKDLMKMVAGG